MHTPNTFHPCTYTPAQPSKSYHIINNKPLTIPHRANTIMTIPCALHCSGDYLLKPPGQHFVEQPVHYTPVIIHAENDNLSVYFINHSDQEVVIRKHSYVRVMEKCPKTRWTYVLRRHFSGTCLSTRIWMLNAFPKVTFCPNKVNGCTRSFQENSSVFGSSIADLTRIFMMLNPSNRECITIVSTIVRKSKNRWRRCYKIVSLNPVLVLWPVLLH